MKAVKVFFFFFSFCFGLVCMVDADSGSSFLMKDERTFKDQKGRIVTVEKPCKRIISLYGAHTENLFYLGLNTEIIGVTRSDKYPKEVKGKLVFSQRDDPEKFLAEKPDLILIRPMLDRGYAKLFSRLEKNGIRIVSLQPKNIDEMFTYWEILGLLTGQKKQARQMTDQFKQAVDDFRLLTLNVHNKKQVYFEAIHKKMKTFTPGAMADFVLVTAGGINVAIDGTPSRGTNIARYGKERIMARSSQIEVFISQKGPMNPVTRDIIKNEPGFQIIKAVKNDKILIVDEKIVSRPTMRLLLGISEIGTYLYPEFFKAGTQKIFKNVFGKK